MVVRCMNNLPLPTDCDVVLVRVEVDDGSRNLRPAGLVLLVGLPPELQLLAQLHLLHGRGVLLEGTSELI